MKLSTDTNDFITENFVVELDKYWPFGLESSNEPENPDLLFVHSQELASRIQCRFCTGDGDVGKAVELEARMRYSSGKQTREVLFEAHETEYQDFSEGYDIKSQNLISCTQLLRPKCCSRDGVAVTVIPEKDIKFTRLFRYFYQNNRILVYLKLDPASAALIPFELDESFAVTMKASYMNAFWAYPKKIELMDTLDKDLAAVDEGFGMKLRDYQLRSVSWMRSIESVENLPENTIVNNVSAWSKEPAHLKIKLGFTGYYIGFKEGEPLSADPKTETIEPLRIYGGILADDTGSGKSITTLGLIYSNPFTEEKGVERIKRFKDLSKYSQSRASCIICPENIQLQWIEKAQKCYPDFKIVSYVKVEDALELSLEDVCDADIVLTSYQFLASVSKKKYKTDWTFENVHFYRIVLDESHELTPTRSDVNSVLKRMRADHIWGLTGTPNFSSLDAVLRYFNVSARLDSVVASNIPAHNEFIRKFVKRNEPDLGLPPMETETIWVQLSSSERFLMNWKMERASRRARLMMCSHYQLAGKKDKAAFLTLEQVKARIVDSKRIQVENYQKQIDELVEWFTLDKELDALQKKMLTVQIAAIQRTLDETQRKLNYCQSVFRVIDEPAGNKCNICYETVEEDSLSILPCSHIFCYECVLAALRSNRCCPLCRQDLPKGSADVFKIVPENTTINTKLDSSRYSSKMIALTKYLMDLMETREDAKIILFLQYKDLGDFISDTLEKELQLKHVRVSGDVTRRHAAIKQFCESKDVRLIMLSSEDSVSGIDLVQATHVILLHPFYTDQGEDVDVAYEKQGISRAYRFGLKHPLKVVRFAVRGTIEEEITNRRQ